MLLDVVYDAFSGYCINWGTGCGYAFPECSPVAVGIGLESLICCAVYMESVRGVVCAASDIFPHVLPIVGESCLQCSTTMRECCHSIFGMSDSVVAVVLILSHIADAVFSVCSTLRLHVPTDAIMSVLYDCLSVFMAGYRFGTAFAIASPACDRGNAH